MREKTIRFYELSELEPSVRTRVIEGFRDDNVGSDWWEGCFDTAKEAGALLGITVDDIRFSGFWSQGDGASFTGRYECEPRCREKIGEEFPMDLVLQGIAEALHTLQWPRFFQLVADVSRDHSRFYHEYSTSVEVRLAGDGYDSTADEVARTELSDIMRRFMQWIYRLLEREHEYLTSDEQVTEMIEANEYEFTEDGSLA